LSHIIEAIKRRLAFRPSRTQLRLGLRVAVAALTAFVLAQFLTVPLAGLWAVLTAVIVTQMSVGGSLKAIIEYSVGTLGGAVYAAALAVAVPQHDEITLLMVLALAVGPMALLAAINPHFRAAPFTAVIVVLGSTTTHIGPIGSALYRVAEVALGAAAGLVVSLLVLPARAHVLTADAAARMLDLLAQALPDLFAGFTRPLDTEEVRTIQGNIGAAFVQVDALAAEARRERMTYLAAEPDPGPLQRTLLRLRHDLVMVGRAAAEPLPERFKERLGAPLAAFAEAAAAYLRASAARLKAQDQPPAFAAVEAALDAYAEAIAAVRREHLTQDLPIEAVERIFALGFALEQLRQNFSDLARCLTEFAQPAGAPPVATGEAPTNTK
jgi:uncharacterized membrane protein YccC